MDKTIAPGPGIVFDMDGTLVDTEALHIKSWIEICKEYEIPFKHNWIHDWVGISDTNISLKLVKMYGLEITGNKFVKRKRAIFQGKSLNDLEMFDGVKSGLDKLTHVKKAVATMSNAFEAKRSLGKTGIRDHFLAVVSADDVANHKPHPDCYLLACQLANINPKTSFAVEDSVFGIDSAKSAGLFTIGVANSIPINRLDNADMVVNNTAQAMDYLSSVFEV